jgi:translation elongation factor EF-Tu-like GTPase
MKKLIIETNLFEGKLDDDGTGRVLVSGVLQRAGAENQNGRVYPREILEREVNEYQKLINERRALGELDHPDSSVINLKNVSHNIKEIHWKGNDLMGTVEILPTPSGNILKELLRSNITLGISSRGMGSTENIGEGKVKVGEDFELIGWDFVSNPSTHGAFMRPMNESVQNQIGTDICGKFCKAQDLMREIITEIG